jgi:hypothetical protein
VTFSLIDGIQYQYYVYNRNQDEWSKGTLTASSSTPTINISFVIPSYRTSYQIDTFALAHPTYGTLSGNDFSLNTLAPVFKIVMAQEVPRDISPILDLSITDPDTGVGYQLDKVQNKLILSPQADNKTFFISVRKSSLLSLGADELKPGRNYKYSLTAKTNVSFIFDGNTTSSISGIVEVKNITFTLPTSNWESLVDLGVSGQKGLSSLTPIFQVHSKYDILNFNPSRIDDGYGILDHLNVYVNGQKILNSGNTPSLKLSEASATTFKLQVLNNANLSKATSYTLLGEATTGLMMNVAGNATQVLSQDLPSTMTIQME